MSKIFSLGGLFCFQCRIFAGIIGWLPTDTNQRVNPRANDSCVKCTLIKPATRVTWFDVFENVHISQPIIYM